jgi:hypothetical protein
MGDSVKDKIDYLKSIYEVDSNLEELRIIIDNIYDDLDFEIKFEPQIIISTKVNNKKKGLYINYYNRYINNQGLTYEHDILYLNKFVDDYIHNSTKETIKVEISINRSSGIIENNLEYFKSISKQLHSLEWKFLLDDNNHDEPEIEISELNRKVQYTKFIFVKEVVLEDIKGKIDKSKLPKHLVTKFDDFVTKYSIPRLGKIELINMLSNDKN